MNSPGPSGARYPRCPLIRPEGELVRRHPSPILGLPLRAVPDGHFKFVFGNALFGRRDDLVIKLSQNGKVLPFSMTGNMGGGFIPICLITNVTFVDVKV